MGGAGGGFDASKFGGEADEGDSDDDLPDLEVDPAKK